MSIDPQIVTNAGLERELCLLQASAMNSRSGIFGPQSAMWRIDREAAIFLGAGRAPASSVGPSLGRGRYRTALTYFCGSNRAFSPYLRNCFQYGFWKP